MSTCTSGLSDTFSLIILCGGRSLRMGRDKASLPFGGGTLLSCQRDKARSLGIRDVLCCGPGGIPDRYPGRGPLAGVHAGLLSARHSRCIVIPVDMPLLPAEELLRLARRHLQGTAEVTLAAHGGRTEPLVGVYESRLAPAVSAYLAAGYTRVTGFLSSVTCFASPSPLPERCFANVNTPGDFCKISEL